MERETVHRESLPKGLRFMGPETDPAFRRRRWIFVVLYVLIGSMVLWPVFPFFAEAKPLILGLPQSMAWVVLALSAMCALLTWLFLSEKEED